MRLLRIQQLLMVTVVIAGTVMVMASIPVKAQRLGRDEKSGKMHKRMEQLFIWRVSDKLQLTPQEEEKFAAEFKKISEERSTLSGQLDDILDQIDKTKDDQTKASKLLSDYDVTLKKYNQTQSKEMDTMKKLFDTKRMVQYVLLKRDMTHKFKDVLTQASSAPLPGKVNTAPEKSNLKEPEVYQEK